MKKIINQNKVANTVKIAAVALIFQAVIATSPVANATENVSDSNAVTVIK